MSRSLLRETLETVAIALVLTLVIRHFVVESFVVRGSSMEPTLHDGQRLLVSKFVYWFRPPHRGDIIIFRSPVNRRDDLVKRVVGLPGERIEIVRGRVLVNGQALDEPYLQRRDRSNMPPLEVQPGHYFVLGDNRPNSEDSRFFGVIDRGAIKGEAVLVWWPPASFATLP